MSSVYIIMGVSGSGKSTIAKLLSKKTSIPFFDGDAFHPQKNIDKMTQGVPLNDEDRQPWLEALNLKLNEFKKGKGAILACSALKESYREIVGANCNVIWIFLSGTIEMVEERLNKRSQHFMNTSLLQSQFDCLEEPVYGTKISIANTPEAIVQQILTTEQHG